MKYRRRWQWPLLAFVSLILFSYGLYRTCYTRKDHEGYRQVMEEVALSGSKGEGITRQRRQGVHKEMWVKSGEERLEVNLTSAHSELVLNLGGSEVVERMIDVSIRYNNALEATAERGEYDMGTQIFTLNGACKLHDKLQHFTLTCPGEAVIDHNQLQVVLTAHTDEQVLFFDHLGKVYADHATIDYVLTNGMMTPKKVILEGNVRIINREGSLLQYVLADHAEYFPESRKMHFRSNRAKRVLFYDRANNLQVSAPALNIQRDAISNKNSIQGLGDVRFHLVEEELQQLKKRFQFEKDHI